MWNNLNFGLWLVLPALWSAAIAWLALDVSRNTFCRAAQRDEYTILGVVWFCLTLSSILTRTLP
jgi:hypothetical protein